MCVFVFCFIKGGGGGNINLVFFFKLLVKCLLELNFRIPKGVNFLNKILIHIDFDLLNKNQYFQSFW